MISGTITLGDKDISFFVNPTNTVDYRIEDLPNNQVEHFTDIPMSKFFKALAIAVHADGTPDYQKDYPDAESIMGEIRWIP